jgi:hypothetical protein
MHHRSGLHSFAVPAALALTIALCACAQSSHSPAKETPAMTSTVTEQPYRVHTLDEFPQFTPQEMGQRMLALIDSIHSVDQFTLEHVRKVTGFPMERVAQPALVDYSLTIHLPESNWYYWLDYEDRENPKRRGATFGFSNPSDRQGTPDKDYWINMAPACLDYLAYVAALERMGFEKKRDFYNHRRWLEATLYERGDVSVEVRARDEYASQAEEAKRGRVCLKYISVGVSIKE